MTAPDLGITDEAEIAAAQQLLDTEWDWRVIGPQKHKECDHYSADCPSPSERAVIYVADLERTVGIDAAVPHKVGQNDG